MKDLAEALALVLDGLVPLEAEQVSLGAGRGPRGGRRARSAVDLPPFDRSAMDGYAVRAADVSPGTPLRVIGDAAAGGAAGAAVTPGTAVEDLDRRGDPARARTPSCASRTPRCRRRSVVAGSRS